MDNQTTYSQRADAQETRIDGVMANSMAIPYIRRFEVEKGPMIPTHSVVKLYLDLEKVGEPRGFIKSLPSLKYMLGYKIAKETEGMEDFKERANQAKRNERRTTQDDGQATKRQGTSLPVLPRM